MEQGDIEYLGAEAAEVTVGEAVVDGEAVREVEEETLMLWTCCEHVVDML